MRDVVSGPRPLVGIVEDDPAVLHSLEFALQAEGYVVLGFLEAEKADACAELLHADCLVLDYALSTGTGVQLLRALRRRGLQCPAIVIASNPSAQCRKDCRAIGAPLIEKPLMGGELSAAIRAAVTAER